MRWAAGATELASRQMKLLPRSPHRTQLGFENSFLAGDPDDHELQIVRAGIPERVRLIQQDGHTVALADRSVFVIHLRLAFAVKNVINLFDSRMPVQPFGR